MHEREREKHSSKSLKDIGASVFLSTLTDNSSIHHFGINTNFFQVVCMTYNIDFLLRKKGGGSGLLVSHLGQ